MEAASIRGRGVRRANTVDDDGNVSIEFTLYNAVFRLPLLDSEWWSVPDCWDSVEREYFHPDEVEEVLEDSRWLTHDVAAFRAFPHHIFGRPVGPATMRWIVDYSDQPLGSTRNDGSVVPERS